MLTDTQGTEKIKRYRLDPSGGLCCLDRAVHGDPFFTVQCKSRRIYVCIYTLYDNCLTFTLNVSIFLNSNFIFLWARLVSLVDHCPGLLCLTIVSVKVCSFVKARHLHHHHHYQHHHNNNHHQDHDHHHHHLVASFPFISSIAASAASSKVSAARRGSWQPSSNNHNRHHP